MPGQIGFGREDEVVPSVYDQYVGRAVRCKSGESGGEGILRKVDIEKGYIVLRPAIILDVGDSLRLETKVDTLVPIASGTPPQITPLSRGYLKREIIACNMKVRREGEGNQ